MNINKPYFIDISVHDPNSTDKSQTVNVSDIHRLRASSKNDQLEGIKSLLTLKTPHDTYTLYSHDTVAEIKAKIKNA